MKTWIPVVVVVVAAAAVGFALESPGPIGQKIWPTEESKDAGGELIEPKGLDLALLMFMGGIEALAFGFGVAFLVFGFSWVNRTAASTRPYAVLVLLAITWSLVNWVAHTALHRAHGNIDSSNDYGGLIAIEYGFHLTLIVAAVLVAHFFLRALRAGTMMTAPTRKAGATKAKAA